MYSLGCAVPYKEEGSKDQVHCLNIKRRIYTDNVVSLYLLSRFGYIMRSLSRIQPAFAHLVWKQGQRIKCTIYKSNLYRF